MPATPSPSIQSAPPTQAVPALSLNGRKIHKQKPKPKVTTPSAHSGLPKLSRCSALDPYYEAYKSLAQKEPKCHFLEWQQRLEQPQPVPDGKFVAVFELLIRQQIQADKASGIYPAAMTPVDIGMQLPTVPVVRQKSASTKTKPAHPQQSVKKGRHTVKNNQRRQHQNQKAFQPRQGKGSTPLPKQHGKSTSSMSKDEMHHREEMVRLSMDMMTRALSH
jgi:hypothetical protein